jgi:hypothetical protein
MERASDLKLAWSSTMRIVRTIRASSHARTVLTSGLAPGGADAEEWSRHSDLNRGPAVAEPENAVFVTYDLGFTTAVLLAIVAQEGVCTVLIRRPKLVGFGHTAEIILRNVRSWPGMFGDVMTVAAPHRAE